MSQDYTFDHWQRHRAVTTIVGLSYDAAVEIARATSLSGDRCTVSTDHKRDMFGTQMVRVLVFRGGKQVDEYIASAELD